MRYSPISTGLCLDKQYCSAHHVGLILLCFWQFYHVMPFFCEFPSSAGNWNETSQKIAAPNGLNSFISTRAHWFHTLNPWYQTDSQRYLPLNPIKPPFSCGFPVVFQLVPIVSSWSFRCVPMIDRCPGTVNLQWTYNWHTVDIQLTYKWHTTDIQLTYIWYTTDNQPTYNWQTTDRQMTYNWATLDNWQTTDIQLTYHWHTIGIQLTYNWHTNDIQLAPSTGIQLTY